MKPCPICGAATSPWRVGAALAVARCTGCGHALAEHGGVRAEGDYHAQYGPQFLASLQATRLRQAKVLLDLVRRHAPGATRLLDYGCGRGWFLDEARRSGFQAVAGVDASELAVDALRARGIEAALVPPDRPEAFDPRTLSFTPQVVTILDVVEHFPVDQARALLTALRERTGCELRLVVVKVPVSHGLLYRAASTLARVGTRGLLEQLYQVGTSPPHVSYFSRRSVALLLEAAGYDVLSHTGDRDFEPTALVGRVRILERFPPWVASAAGGALAAAIGALGMHDSLITVAVPRRA
jgi:SAM-dependent methyltransferase